MITDGDTHYSLESNVDLTWNLWENQPRFPPWHGYEQFLESRDANNKRSFYEI